MPTWVPCGSGFIEADVVRWKEGVWERRGHSKKSRAVNKEVDSNPRARSALLRVAEKIK